MFLSPRTVKLLELKAKLPHTSTVERKVPPGCFSSLSTLEPIFALELCFSFHDDLQVLKNITVKKYIFKRDKGNEKKTLLGGEGSRSCVQKAANREISCFC